MALYVSNPYGRMMAHRRLWNRMIENELADRPTQVVFPVDVKVEDDAYMITALLPGVSVEDLNLQIVSDTVTIQGELSSDREEDSTYLLRERPSGRFYRTIGLPEPLDASKAEATMKDGVLSLRIPKAEEARPKTIKVLAR